MKLSIETPFNLIIDEFQEFFNVAPAVYSEMQHYWDINKDKSRINLLLSGSVQSLMYTRHSKVQKNLYLAEQPTPCVFLRSVHLY